MNVRKARKLRDALMLIGVVVMLCAYLYEPLLIVGAVISVSCLIPHYLFNKCPHCGRQLGLSPKHCPFCGGSIDG